jgi:hypothetical protein
MAESTLAPSAVARLAGGEPLALVAIGGGRNSQVFRLEAADGHTFALKAYFRHPGDSRDRLGTEFRALKFLWEHGLRSIPKPVALDPENALGLYEFIEGPRPEVPTQNHVEEAFAFLASLRPLAALPAAAAFPPASEACFSFKEMADNVQTRFDCLAAVDPDLAHGSGLASFIEDALRPAWETLWAECQAEFPEFDQELPMAERVLSPSDFGFHNALQRNGHLVFLDFEYFGWDDPAKMLADFLLHPGMDLTVEHRRRFAEGLLDRLAIPGLRRRARLAFPLFGIKWCLILLNEFLPGVLDRRAFADRDALPERERQAAQLAKTRLKLQQLLDDHAHFTYFQN